ncbi:MAG: hypothetical protein AAF563_12295 [Pseudomonadota bacterium]
MTALKVKIGRSAKRQADYPDFNRLDTVTASGQDWSHYVDSVGGGWHYDKVCGHDMDEPDSPRGTQWGCLLVDDDFATQAVAAFPGVCSIISEAEFETFHDERAHAHEPEVKEDFNAIQNLAHRRSLGETVPQLEIDKALDPDDPTPGRRKNVGRKWKDRKASMGVTIKKKGR